MTPQAKLHRLVGAAFLLGACVGAIGGAGAASLVCWLT